MTPDRTSTLFLSLLLGLSLSVARAEDRNGVARVLAASTSTTFAGKRVTENEVLTTVGDLKSGADGGAKVRLSGNDVVVELAANSEVRLVIPPSGDPTDSIELVKGRVRVRVPKSAKPEAKDSGKTEKPRFLLRHRKVTMGVRGTDFYSSANDELGETELVVFDGEVEFSNESAPRGTVFVKPGYWSAIGGRFGEKVHAPIRLSDSALAYFSKLASGAPSFTLQAVPTEKTPSSTETAAPGR